MNGKRERDKKLDKIENKNDLNSDIDESIFTVPNRAMNVIPSAFSQTKNFIKIRFQRISICDFV